MAELLNIQSLGNQLQANFDDGTSAIAYPTPTGLWVVSVDSGTGPPDPGDGTLIDTILPGHSFAEGDLATDWQWHLDNNGGPHGRGGNDLNYIFQDFTAPGAGTVDHFDVSGVGMVVRLILDVPAVRTQPPFENDYPGPMQAIWFQHCSASAADGHYNQGDVIGTSGDGYGDYPAHLHVHGREDTNIDSSGVGRNCFWHFI